MIDDEERWKIAFECTGDGMWEWDVGQKRLTISGTTKIMLGYPGDAKAGPEDDWSASIHPDDLPLAEEAMDRHLGGASPSYRCEYRLRCKDASYKWILARGKRIPGREPGLPDLVFGTHKDIHSRHHHADEILHLKEVQIGIIQNAAYAIITLRENGMVTSFNAAAERMLGYSAEEIIGLQSAALWIEPSEIAFRAKALSLELAEFVPPGLEAFLVKARRNLPNESETDFIRKDGTRFPVLLSISARRKRDGSVSEFLATAIDLTEKRKADGELRERTAAVTLALQELKNQRFALDQHYIVAATDIHGIITYANDKFCEISKYPREEILGRNHRFINSGSHSKEFFRDLYKTIHSGRVWHGEIRNRAKDGSFYWVYTTIVPMKNDLGVLHEFIAIRTEITDRKRDEESLAVRQAILEATNESYPGILIGCVDRNYNYLNFNSAVRRVVADLYGNDLKPGSNMLESITVAETRKGVKRDLDRSLAGEAHNHEVRYGNQYWQSRYSPVLDGDGKVFGASFFSEDITARKAEELDRAKISDRLSLACIAGRIGIWENDLINNVLIWDEQMFTLHGIPRDSPMGSHEASHNGVHPADRKRSEEELQAAIMGFKEFNTVYRVLWPDGSIRHIRALAKVLRDGDGKATNLIGTSWDITDRVEAEALLQKAMEAAEISNRAKSEFLSNMSHELRTPLNSVIGFANILLKNKSGNFNDKELNFLSRIADNGRLLLLLINSVLDLSKIESGQVEMDVTCFDLAKAAGEVLDQFESQLKGSKVRFILDAPTDGASLSTDAFKLKQVLVNLVGNALKFTERGSITIRIRLDAPDGAPASLEVADTGIGIPKDRLESIFGAFQQADNSISRRFGGTGLGLTISRTLLQHMGYRLQVASVEGKGSVFSIFFKDSGGREPAVTALAAEANL